MLVALIWEHYESLKYCRSGNLSQSCFHVELAVNLVSMFTTVSSYYYLFLMNTQDLHTSHKNSTLALHSVLNIICTAVFISFFLLTAWS